MRNRFIVILSLFIFSCQKEDSSFIYKAQFAKEGAFEVEIFDFETDSDVPYLIVAPKDIEEPLPVVVWGNGTDAEPKEYTELFKHIASHGFLVIDTYSVTTGTGQEISDAIDMIFKETVDTASLLYHYADTNFLAVAGHSQGSTGVINSYTNFHQQARIKTIVSIALPALKWCDPEDVYDAAKIEVPFLILGGEKDFIISPTATNEQAFDLLSAAVPGCMLILHDAGHLEIQGNGGNYRGFLTAWLQYISTNGASSRKVFATKDAEIYQSPLIKSVGSKNLN